MCNDFGNRVPHDAYVQEFADLKIPLVFPPPEATPNLEPRDEIWPSDTAPVIRPAEGGTALLQLAWGFAPARPGARVVINLRSEGRAFARRRCLVPASHYYEFTGTKSPKTRWRFTRSGAAWFCFAGVIGRGPADAGAFALLTVDAGPDAAGHHTRQPVVLDRDAWAAWLDVSRPAADLLRPSPAGTLTVVEAPRDAKQTNYELRS